MGLLISLLVQQAPQPSIKGIVVRLGTSEPVARAVVQLTRADSSEPRTVSTGNDGAFEFRNVPPGSYRLQASRSGYLDAAYGQRGPSGKGTDLKIEVGKSFEGIRLLMTATGAISGRVFDNSGEPLANLPVQAMKFTYTNGQRTLTQVKADETNDLGEFRLFWLPPGQYYVRATPDSSNAGSFFIVMDNGGQHTVTMTPRGIRSGSESSSSISEKLGEAFVPVYYPGTADPQAASVVEVKPGADVRGIDFTLLRVTTRKVRGTVIDGRTGQPARIGNVTLVPASQFETSFQNPRPPGDNGKFEISGVLPGSYFLVANARAGPESDIKILGGRVPVEIRDSDLDNLTVTLWPAIDLAGTLTVDGRPEGLPPDVHPVLNLLDQRRNFGAGLAHIYASFRTGTQLSFDGVVESDYRLVWEFLEDLPEGMYLKSAQFGAIDALNAGLEINSRTKDVLQIVIGTKAGVIDGVAVDARGNSIPGARVALIPDAAHRQRGDLYRSASTDDSGHFRLERIPPGEYSLFAWEDIENGLWQDPEFIRRHEVGGKPIRISENGRETVEIIAIPFVF